MDTGRVQRGIERKRFSQSSASDKALMLSMMASQALCQRLLGHVSTQRMRDTGETLASIYRRSPLPRPDAERTIGRAELVKALNIWRAECIAESLVLWTCLRAGDHPAQLRIGCRNILGKVEAHMWVELDGVPLLDTDNEFHTWQAFDDPFG